MINSVIFIRNLEGFAVGSCVDKMNLTRQSLKKNILKVSVLKD